MEMKRRNRRIFKTQIKGKRLYFRLQTSGTNLLTELTIDVLRYEALARSRKSDNCFIAHISRVLCIRLLKLLNNYFL